RARAADGAACVIVSRVAVGMLRETAAEAAD
ncbi:MFS transporter, partial [Burkholderia pseudomallei]|nr:MFS transporter [Burkholderia pseudomallei]